MTNIVPLRYIARAGLLPELTRQTYDSLYKALREVVLNGVDAGAKRVVVDLSRVGSDSTLTISDDGSGMSMQALQQSFLSLGGSEKYESASKFGRIGIGSLALMHYAQRVEIRTKCAGDPLQTRAIISHPWALTQVQRSQDLGDFTAGEAWREPSKDGAEAHFTEISLHGVDSVLTGECGDIGSYYKLVDRLRRILPLRWDSSALLEHLEATNPAVLERLRTHVSDFTANVSLRSPWRDEEILSKRMYGDGVAQDERWNGPPHIVDRRVVVEQAVGTRTIEIVGYLLSQARPSPDWSGVTARVQNVAVEERTFFDLETDPGFRKYIAGEVWLLGDVDRTRLINIDRASFSRESDDYKEVARVMQSEINRFKSDCVQAPQRAKVSIKRRLDQQVALVRTAQQIGNALAATHGGTGIPSSRNGRIKVVRSRALLDDLTDLGAVVAVSPEERSGRAYDLRIAADGRRVLAEVPASLAQPEIVLGGRPYRIQLFEGRDTDPPIIIKNRPREVIFNLGHDAFGRQLRESAVAMVTALEVAYLDGARESTDLYDRVLWMISSLT